MFDGQSLVFAPLTGTPPGLTVAAGLTAKVAAHLVGISGTTYATRATTVASRVYPRLGGHETSVLIDCAGYQELAADMTAANLLTAAESYADGCRANGADYVIGCTVPTGTVAWYTSGQQTQRAAYNTLLLASSHFDEIADIAALPHAADPTDTTYFSDGLHPTQTLANEYAGVIETALGTVGIT